MCTVLRGQHLESAHEIAVLGPKRVQFGPVVGRHGEEYSRGCLLMITFLFLPVCTHVGASWSQIQHMRGRGDLGKSVSTDFLPARRERDRYFFPQTKRGQGKQKCLPDPAIFLSNRESAYAYEFSHVIL